MCRLYSFGGGGVVTLLDELSWVRKVEIVPDVEVTYPRGFWSITISPRQQTEDPELVCFDLKITNRALPEGTNWDDVFVAYGDTDAPIDRVIVVGGEATFCMQKVTIQMHPVHLWFEVHVPSSRQPSRTTK